MLRLMTVFVMIVISLGLPTPRLLHAQGGTPSPCPPKDQTNWIPTPEAVGQQVECRLGTTPANLGYLQYLPAGYGSTPKPLIVFFHGNGERGNGTTQLQEVDTHGPPKLIKNGKAFDAIVISPQLPTEPSGWNTAITTPFVQYLLDTYHVDRDRVYITGLSLGGGGTWKYAKAKPDVVAAIVPICGYETNSAGYEVLRGMPIWAFHRNGDTVVSINQTINILNVITGVDPKPISPGKTGYFNGTSWNWRSGQSEPTSAQENPSFTVYTQNATGDSHDAWTAAYNNQAMWDWLFKQRRQTAPIVFQQDFQSATSVPAYYNPTNPTTGQFNDISSETNGGTWSIAQGRLRLVRTGSSGDDNDAGITRHTDFAGPPTLLHLAFDLGLSNWTNSPFQSNAMLLSIGKLASVRDYGAGDVAADTFQTLSVNGRGPGQFVFATAGADSALLAADGTLHHAELFLNKSATTASYRAPNGTLHNVGAGGVALWVNGALVVETSASNGSSSSLTDLRLRFSSADNATWQLDNIVIHNSFPE